MNRATQTVSGAMACLVLTSCMQPTVGEPAPADHSGPHMVSASELGGLLLTANDLDKTLKVSGLAVSYTGNALTDHSRDFSEPQCAGVGYPAEQITFKGQEVTAVTEQIVRHPQTLYFIDQSLVLVPKAAEARTVLANVKQEWATCNNRILVNQAPGATTSWDVKDLQRSDSGVAITQIQAQTAWGCQRALQVTANLVIDISVCMTNVQAQAQQIAQQISDKVPL